MKRIALLLIVAVAAIACQKEEPVVPNLELTDPEQELTIATEGGSLAVEFTSTVAWTAAVKDAEWCTVSPESGEAGTFKVNVLAEENKTNDNREAVLVMTAGDKITKEFKLTQLQKDALVLEGEKAYEMNLFGGEIKIAVNHNVPFTLEVPDWIEAPATKAMVKDELVFKVKAQPKDGEERRGNIIIKNDVKNVTITVKQAKWEPKVEVTGAKLVIPQAGGEATFSLRTSMEVDVKVTGGEWATPAVKDNVYTYKAKGANDAWGKRSIFIQIVPKDEALQAKFTRSIVVSQDGTAKILWHVTPTKLAGYNSKNYASIARMGNQILVANTDKVYVINAADGKLAQTINVPANVRVDNIVVDAGGNILVAGNTSGNARFIVYRVTDIKTFKAVEVVNYNTANYYGTTNTGNLRVNGDVTKNAVITAISSVYPSFLLAHAWEVKDGKAGTVNYYKVPFAVENFWGHDCGAVIGAGTKLADGLYGMAYKDPYHLNFNATGAKDGPWDDVFKIGIGGNDNLHGVSIAEFKGKKYMAILVGAHFTWTDVKVMLLDITDPSKITKVYEETCYNFVKRDKDGKNLDWTEGTRTSDVALSVDGNTMTLQLVEPKFNTLAAIEFK